jgi:hypothetical protein
VPPSRAAEEVGTPLGGAVLMAGVGRLAARRTASREPQTMQDGAPVLSRCNASGLSRVALRTRAIPRRDDLACDALGQGPRTRRFGWAAAIGGEVAAAGVSVSESMPGRIGAVAARKRRAKPPVLLRARLFTLQW